VRHGIQSKAVEYRRNGRHAWSDHDCLTGDQPTIVEPQAIQPVVGDLKPFGEAENDPDSASGELLGLSRRWGLGRMREKYQVGRPLTEQQRLMCCHGSAGQYPDRTAPDLPAMTVGTVHHIIAPAFAYSWYIGKVVGKSTRHHQPPRDDPWTSLKGDFEAPMGLPGGHRGPRLHPSAVSLKPLTAQSEQLARRYFITAQEAMHSLGLPVARVSVGVQLMITDYTWTVV
jgi:hypothetical protein